MPIESKSEAPEEEVKTESTGRPKKTFPKRVPTNPNQADLHKCNTAAMAAKKAARDRQQRLDNALKKTKEKFAAAEANKATPSD